MRISEFGFSISEFLNADFGRLNAEWVLFWSVKSQFFIFQNLIRRKIIKVILLAEKAFITGVLFIFLFIFQKP